MSALYITVSCMKIGALYPGASQIEYSEPLEAAHIPIAKKQFAQLAKRRNLALKTVTPAQLETLAKRRAAIFKLA